MTFLHVMGLFTHFINFQHELLWAEMLENNYLCTSVLNVGMRK